MDQNLFPIPVTLVTGFLGAGKTTFINDLTARNPHKKFAIIENEFGEVSIDQELLLAGNESIYEINGGCICCTVSGELITYLLNLNKEGIRFDHLIIETTGIAEPLSIAEPFLAHPVIQQKYRLDGIICLVDSEFVEEGLREQEVVVRQISAADLILFNKTDCVGEDYLQEVKSLLQKINPLARTYDAQHGKVADLNFADLQANTPQIYEQLQEEVEEHHHHQHGNITSYSFSFPEPLDYAKFYQWASMLMQFQSGRFYRMKGILNFKGEAEKAIFQGVKNRFALTKGSPWPADSPRLSKLVFIGKELKKEQLLRNLRQCFAKDL